MLWIFAVGRISGNSIRMMRTSGFSLLELMIVLVIASLMTALTVPWLSGAMNHMNLKTAARQTAAVLRYARSLAASENRTIAAVVDRQRHLLYIAKDSNRQTGISKMHTYQLPDGISFNEDYSNGQTITDRDAIFFYPSGNSSGGNVILRNEKNQLYRILVDPITGSVQIEG